MKSHKVERNQQTWFFERPDNSIIAVQGQEAWSIYKGRNQVAGIRTIPFKMVGSSDGSLYKKAVEESHKIFQETGDVNKSQERLRLGFNEELESARGKMIIPMNHDTIDRGGRPISIDALSR